MPCKGNHDNFTEFCDCIDQLAELVTKYIDHDVLIGGDFNEDICCDHRSRRMLYLDRFINEFKMKYFATTKTFIHSNGKDCSSIDYFIVRETPTLKIGKVETLDLLGGNTSDHHPVKCTIEMTIDNPTNPLTDRTNISTPSRVNWSKVNTDLYSFLITEELNQLALDLSRKCTIDYSIALLHDVMLNAVLRSGGAPTQRRRTSARSITPAIKEAMCVNKEAHYIYKLRTHDGTLSAVDVERRKNAKKVLRTLMRREDAKHQTKLRSDIMAARRDDSKLFHKLVKQQRGSSSAVVPQLEVHGTIHRGEDDIRLGWKLHFEALAISSSSPHFDNSYQCIVDYDIDVIKDIFQDEHEPVTETSIEEVTRAIESLNKGKSPDVFGITAENIVFGGDALIATLCDIFNAIFYHQSVPDILKAGTITPVYKNKGSKLDAKNYRGITVLPVIAKILELILRDRLRNFINRHQNPQQRGFTCGASPLFCALIIEEFIRETTGKKCTSLTAYLDAKTAFDVVYHNSLLRKLYHMGIGGGLWNILCSFYEHASSVVKWMGNTSDEFIIEQGVRQGGILSADLYKVYINQLLDRLYYCGFGAKIGDIICNAPTCADDLSTLGDSTQELQMLCSIANDYSKMERYELQPKKSVVLPHLKKRSKTTDTPVIFLGDQQMPVVDKTTHVGVVRTPDNSPTTAIQENLQKLVARYTALCLLASMGKMV
ncbi:hypothetical protein FSP39_021572 [Pinctada imbricata]|uniref:Reverse transcriptase domain-containing protein n=1 Tax=Pinctada imbricata TaxID=66713 RepID=A0AA88Y5S6_PINIB|nr:hypothetical protein FSP39_021572 [Pinctada imbricata]